MQIPKYFMTKAARQFGDAGPGWVRRLPSLLARCQEQWRLTGCVPADDLSINLVCYAQSEIFGNVVLKIAGPHNEGITEMTALRLYDGHMACKCLAADEEIVAVLLERIVPGRELRALPDRRAQLEIGGKLVAGLPIALDRDYGFPNYGDWVANAVATTRARYDPDERIECVMAEMEQVFGEICPPDAPQALLHGDLHHDNILQHRDGEWKVIDPQGVIGAPFMETARFIQNHAIDWDGALSEALLDESVTYLANLLGETKRTIASAVFVLNVLSTCWGCEMNYARERIAQQIDQCERLLAYARRV